MLNMYFSKTFITIFIQVCILLWSVDSVGVTVLLTNQIHVNVVSFLVHYKLFLFHCFC